MSQSKKRHCRKRHNNKAKRSSLHTAERLESRHLLAANVTTFLDVVDAGDGETSLREAIIEANATPGKDVINVPSGTYHLTIAGHSEDGGATGDLDITESVVIVGEGRNATFVDAQGIDRVFHVIGGSSTEVKIQGVTLTGGIAQSANGNDDKGGGLRNNGGDVILFDSAIRGNLAEDGGPAFYNATIGANAGGMVRLMNSPMTSNSTVASGNTDSLLGDLGAMLGDNRDTIISGVDDALGSVVSTLESALNEFELPGIGDQVAEAFEPLLTGLEDVRIGTVDFLDSVIDIASAEDGSTLPEVFQAAMYLTLGPGDAGFAELPEDLQLVLSPLRPLLFDTGINILKDGPDLGSDIGLSDIVVTIGEDKNNRPQTDHGVRFIEYNFHVGQKLRYDLPEFDVGLKSFVDVISGSDLDINEEAAGQARNFLDTFGFNVSAENGIRIDLAWDGRLGFGMSGQGGPGFFVNSGATKNGLPDGVPIEELRASVVAFAAPNNDGGGFGQQFSDVYTTPSLTANASLGLVQAEVSDGTPVSVQVTAPVGVPSVLTLPAANIEIIVDGDEANPIELNIEPFAADFGASLPELLLQLNGQLIDHYESPFPDLSFTLDFSPINRFYNPDLPTTPHLVLNALAPAISTLEIRGAEGYNFLPVQYENRRATGMGFSNNVASSLVGVNQELDASLPAPADGISVEDPFMVIWLGGQRVVRDGTTITEGGKAITLTFREILNRDIATMGQLEAKLNELLRHAVGTTTNYDPDRVWFETVAGPDGDQFRLVAEPGLDPSEADAPLITVTYPTAEQSKITATVGMDIVSPDYDESKFNTDRTNFSKFNRLKKATFESKKAEGKLTELLKPVAKAKAQLRLHVETNANHFEQFVGLENNALGLPELSFDFILDASADLTKIKKNENGSGLEAGNVFKIDTLLFDAITLDISSFIENVVTPVADGIAEMLEPVLSFIGRSEEDSEATLNKRIPVISDLARRDITLRQMLDDTGLGEFTDEIVGVLDSIENLSENVTQIVQDIFDEGLEGVSEDGIRFGGLELVMNPESFLYFPKTKVPVPIGLSSTIQSIEEVGLGDFMRTFSSLSKFAPPGFSFDLFTPQTVFNMLLGQPFNIVSFGLPQVSYRGGIDFGFDIGELEFDIAGGASFDANLRLVYDSYGIEQIIDSARENQAIDWSDLIDGLALQNNPAGYEVGASLYFVGTGAVEDVGIDAGGFLGLFAELGLEIDDLNQDGKLRLDEVLEITDDFTDPGKLLCMVDILSNFAADAGYFFDDTSGRVGLDTGDFSLQNLLGSAFGLCQEDHTPILAEEVEIDGQSVLRINTGPSAGARINGDTIDNSRDPISKITEETDGSATISYRDGETLTFLPPATPGEPYIAPEGDGTILKKIDGKFQRIFPPLAEVVGFDTILDFLDDHPQLSTNQDFDGLVGGVIHHFNENNLLERKQNGLLEAETTNGVFAEETYQYDATGQLTRATYRDGSGAFFFPNVDITARTLSDGSIAISGYGVTDQVYSGTYDKIVAVGSPFDDHFDFQGVTNLSVEVAGLGGHDQIAGGSQADLLDGGLGDDDLTGNDGNDILLVGRGVNDASDGLGDDFIDFRENEQGVSYTTGGGADKVLGTDFDDTIESPPLNTDGVEFHGFKGRDELIGGQGPDILNGGAGSDVLRGKEGGDRLLGEAGADTIIGGLGRDQIEGGTGPDSLTAGIRDVIVSGNGGIDRLTFEMVEAHEGVLTNFEYAAQMVNGTTPYFSVESIEVDLGGAAFSDNRLTIDGPTLPLNVHSDAETDDTVVVKSLAELNDATQISLGAGNDKVQIIETDRELVLDGGSNGSDALVVDRSHLDEPLTGELNGHRISGLLLPNLTYANFEELRIDLGNGIDQFLVADTAVEVNETTVTGGWGADNLIVQRVSSPTILNGNRVLGSANTDPDTDRATLIVDGVSQNWPQRFANLSFAIDELFVDSSTVPQAVDWRIEEVGGGGTILFETVDPLSGAVADELISADGVNYVIFEGGQSSSDALHVVDPIDATQFIWVRDDEVQIDEGQNVIGAGPNREFSDFSSVVTVDGINGARAIATSPDESHIYVTGVGENSISVFRVNPDGALSFIQVLKNDEFGVTGLTEPDEIVVSPDGEHVYAASPTDNSVAIFRRIPTTGRLVYQSTLGGVSGIASLAISSDGSHLYGADSGSTIYRMNRNDVTGAITLAETRVGLAANIEAIAVGRDDRNVFVSGTSGLTHLHVGGSGLLPSNATDQSSINSYTDIATYRVDGQTYVVATYHGGVDYYGHGDVQLTRVNTSPVANPSNAASGISVAVDAGHDQVITSFNVDSIALNESTYTLEWGILKNEGTKSSEEFSSIDLSDEIAFVVQGTGISAAILGPFDLRAGEQIDFTSFFDVDLGSGGEFAIQIGDVDSNGDNDLLDSIVINVPSGKTNYQLEYSALFDTCIGLTVECLEGPDISVDFTIVENVVPTPTIEAISRFDLLGDGTGTNRNDVPLVVYGDDFVFVNGGFSLEEIKVNQLDAIETLADLERYVAVSTAANLLISPKYSDLQVDADDQILEDDVMSVAYVSNGPEHVRTAFSPNSNHTYSVSSRFGVITVGTEGSANSLQTIYAGIRGAADIVVSQDGNHVYVTNPIESSMMVYQVLADGRLELKQVLTDGVHGADGLGGAGQMLVSPDDAFIYVHSPGDGAIGVFERLPGGELTYVSKVSSGLVNEPSDLVFDTLASHVYISSPNTDGLAVFARNATTGELSQQQTIFNPTLDRPTGLAFSPDNKFLYVAATESNNIALYERTASGNLTYRGVMASSVSLDNVGLLTVTPDNRYLIAASNGNALSVFSRDEVTGQLSTVQRLRDGASGIDGTTNVTDIHISDDASRLFISSASSTGNGGVSQLSLNVVQPALNSYTVIHEGMEFLTVESADATDNVETGEVAIPFRLFTNGGDDDIEVRNTWALTTVESGEGNDTIDVLSTGIGVTSQFDGQNGSDQISLFGTMPASTIALIGGMDADTIHVAGAGLQSHVSVRGDQPSPGVSIGDKMYFDTAGAGTFPGNPPLNNGFFRNVNSGFGVTYASIEDLCIIANPHPMPEPANTMEGAGVTLSSSALIPPGHHDVQYTWRINGGPEVDGQSVTLSWNKLVELGIDDDGVYSAELRVTSRLGGEQFLGRRISTLSVSNVAPDLILAGAAAAEVGSTYYLELSSIDPGDDTIHEWVVDWGDGSAQDTYFAPFGVVAHSYRAAGPVTVSAKANDEDGGPYGPTTKLVLVADSREITGASTVDEGMAYELHLSTPGFTTVDDWSVNWGDGTSTSTIAGSQATATHVYTDDRFNTVFASTVDANGETRSGIGPAFVTVLNVAPTIDAIQHPTSILQGETALVEIAASDPGTLDTLSYALDVDDDALFEIISSTSSIPLRFTEVGSYSIPIYVADDDGGVSATEVIDIAVVNAPPTIDNVAVLTSPAQEGSPAMIEVNATDPGGADDRLTYEFDFDNDGTYDLSTSVNRAIHTYPEDGDYTVGVRVTDSLGVSVTDSVLVPVKNVAPTIEQMYSAGPIIEGSQTALAVTIADPGTQDTFTLVIDWGDPLSPDNVETYAFAASETGSQNISLTHQYLDDNPTNTDRDEYTIRATVMDDEGGSSMNTTTTEVENVAPVVTLDPAARIPFEGSATLTGTITDLGTLDTFSISIDWGDPLSTNNVETIDLSNPPAHVTFNETTRRFALNHTYVDIGHGLFHANLTLADDDSESIDLTAPIQRVPPPVEFVAVPTSVSEDQNLVTLTVTAQTAVVGDQSVDVTVAGSVTVGDYNVDSKIMIADGTFTGSITFAVEDDNIVEATETAVLTISNPTEEIKLGTKISEQITISDNDEADLAVPDAFIKESDGTLSFVLELTNPVDLPVSITGISTDGTADSPADYQSLPSTVFTFPALTTQLNVPITVLDDSISEIDETLFLHLSNLTVDQRDVFLDRDQATGTIRDDEPADLGDAPDPSFPTVINSGGARHLVSSLLYFGASVDLERDGNPTPNAMGDDIDGSDDDGVYVTTTVGNELFSGSFIPGHTAQAHMVVTGLGGFVSAWADFNIDGDWDDDGEHIIRDLFLEQGRHSIPIEVPEDAIAINDTFTRFRLSTQAGLTPSGSAPDGEVEDHQFRIDQTLKIKGVQIASSQWSDAFRDSIDPEDNFGYTIPRGANQSLPLPWSNVNQIRLLLNQVPQRVELPSFRLMGTEKPEYEISNVTTDGSSIVLTLNEPIGIDQLRLVVDDELESLSGRRLDGEWTGGQTRPSGDDVSGGEFIFEFNIVPGDSNQSGRVSVDDVQSLRRGLGSSHGGQHYDHFIDINGSGVLAVSDLGPIRTNLGKGLPTPTIPALPIELAEIRDSIDSVMEQLGSDEDEDDSVEPTGRFFDPLSDPWDFEMVQRIKA